MARPVWKGHISFGLVHIPVNLFNAQKRTDISFHLVDSKNASRVRYERVNEVTGEEVPWDRIVKGFEYSDGHYVLLTEEEMKSASIEMTRTIEIEQFVLLKEIDVIYYDRPYVLVPAKGGEKGYNLLRDALEESGKAGVATVVIRARQYLCLVHPAGELLRLILLRFHQELQDLSEYEVATTAKTSASKRELQLALQLIKGMTKKWNPKKYDDEYREALMNLIQGKIDAGDVDVVTEIEREPDTPSPATNVVDFAEILKRSVAKKTRSGTAKTAAKKSVPKKPVSKKRTVSTARKTASRKTTKTMKTPAKRRASR